MSAKPKGETLRTYALRMGMEHLLTEWAEETLTPDDVTPGCRRRLRWRCGRGHEWETTVDVRCAGAGCPYCAGRRPIVGETDLSARCPELIAEWHPTKNGELLPTDFSPGSRRKVWWRCRLGHEWQAAISARSLGTGCPVCAGKKAAPGETDFATLYPALAAQWGAQNGDLKPCDLRPCSNKKVWWTCEKGHSWQATVNGRVSLGSGCPYCANRRVMPGFNDLETLFPEIAAEWHPALNGALTPSQIVAGSHHKAWWICREGHVWQAVIAARTGTAKSGCPLCAGNVSREWRARHARELAAVLPKDGA